MNVLILNSMNYAAPRRRRTSRLHLLCWWGALCIIGLAGFAQQVAAQPVNPEIRVAAREDNKSVYIYHTALPSISHGFNIYRKDAGRDSFIRLNTDPVRGVASGAELRAFLGTFYDDIERTTGQITSNGTLTKLRSDLRTANLLTFVYPKIAEALGRLYIDSSADMETAVTYRIEFVDALDEPVGDPIEKTVLLLPQKPVAPTRLRAQNQGNRMTMYWQFIPPNQNADDSVIRFEAFRIDPTTNQHQRLHDNVILRNSGLFEYALTFDVPTTGQTEQLYVQSIDIIGQASEPSPILRYDALDVEPPNAIVDVNARLLSNNRVQISWSASDTKDIAGFHIYRSTELTDESAYVRLNRDLLSLNESTFNDTLLAGQDGRVYYYRMAAVDASGNAGLLSTAAMALVTDGTPPPPPSDLMATYEDGQAHLDWRYEEAPDDFETFIVLRRRLSLDAPALPFRVNPTEVRDTTFLDDGIAGQGFAEGSTYRYAVLSSDRAGNFSEPVYADLKIPDLTAPAPPNGAQAIIDNASRIAVFWNPSPSLDVMSYIVYRRESGSTHLKATPVPIFERRFEDTRVETGMTYEYWITAADSAGNESVKSATATLQMRDFLSPRHVRHVQAARDDSEDVAIRWEPVAALDLAGYRVEYAPAIADEFAPLHESLISETFWIDSGASAARCYQVFAVDTSGNDSKPSQPVCVPQAIGQ